MYVENFVPLDGASQKAPVVFIHGDAQTGTVSQDTLLYPPSAFTYRFWLTYLNRLQNWFNTPDGWRGWASWFLAKGYNVHMPTHPRIHEAPAEKFSPLVVILGVRR